MAKEVRFAFERTYPRASEDPVKPQGNNVLFLALVFVVVSMFYDLPIIYVFAAYRVNPRLFDVAFLVFMIAVILYFRHRSPEAHNRLIAPWGVCVYGIVLSSLVSMFWIPIDFQKY